MVSGAPAQRIAVLLEPGARGRAALRCAAVLAGELEAEVTIVALVPRAESPRCGGAHADAYQSVIRAQVAAELSVAAAELRRAGPEPREAMLEDGRDLPLAGWIAEHGFGLVLLPARRSARTPGHHPLARPLRAAGAQVSVVGR